MKTKEEQNLKDKNNKIKRQVSIITVFLLLFLVVSMITIVINNVKNSNALEEENTNNLLEKSGPILFDDKIVYSPRGEFTPTDNTPICVQKWDFNNIKHPYEYYKYLMCWYNNTQYAQYAQYAQYVNNESDSSCFERCKDFDDRESYMPRILQSRIVHPGENVILPHYNTIIDFGDIMYGMLPQVPSVYLYDIVDVTQGEEYIDGGKNAIHFYASNGSDNDNLWPYVSPKVPHIRMNTPIKEDAPNEATIQVRFRLAYGYEGAWWGNSLGYNQSLGKGNEHREDNYFWYVEDFIYTMIVDDVDNDNVNDVEDVDVEHHVYMPAGTSVDISISKPYYIVSGEKDNPSYIEDGMFSIHSYGLTKSGNKNIASISPFTKSGNNDAGDKLTSTITSNIEAKKDDITTFVVKYIYGAAKITQTEKIVVHIIEPRNEVLDVGMSKQINLCQNASGIFTKGKINSSDRSIINVSETNFNETGYEVTRNSDGEAAVICDYKFTDKIKTDNNSYYDHFQTIVVDVVNFIPNETKEYVILTYIDRGLQYKQDKYEKDYKAIISSMTNTRENYVFKGWGTNPNAVEVVFNSNDIVILNDNMTLYAIWEEVKSKDVIEDYNLPITSDTNIVMYVIIFMVVVIIAIIVIVIMRKNKT